MKKLATLILTFALALCAIGNTTVKAEDTTVYVTIVNGAVVLTQKAVTVTDVDADGALTINDALYCAHETNYEGGAAAGYGSAMSDWGLSLTKLWGIENGGSYGYYLNNGYAMGLADAVKNGDYINAFVYQDTTAWSDTYCYFNVNTVDADTDTELTLSAFGYDAEGNAVVLPVAGAVITLNGEKTALVTDENGKATVKAAAKDVISAVSDTQNLVAPVCVAVAKAAADETPKTGDSKVVIALAGLCMIACAAVVVTRKKEYEA